MIIPADIRSGNICIPVDTTGHFFVAETEQDSDYARWLGFKQAMEKMAASAAAPAMWWFPRNPGAD